MYVEQVAIVVGASTVNTSENVVCYEVALLTIFTLKFKLENDGQWLICF